MSATRLSFSYPQEMKEELQKLAENDQRSLSSYIQVILANHIEKKNNGPSANIPSKPKRRFNRSKSKA